MDFDTLDATQAIYHEEFEDETDEDTSASQRKPVAYLTVQEQKGLQNKEYPVYEGDNIIGRHESCQICIPSKSLSKEHACIAVKRDSHLIFDKGSRNKTKRGKLFLSPDVRYELKDKNELWFADVKCMYSMVTKIDTDRLSGSETEEEKTDSPEKAASSSSSLSPSPRKNRNSNQKSATVLCAQSDEEDYASDASSDILQPTQPYSGATTSTAGLSKTGGATGNVSYVLETPDFLKKPIDVTATLVLPESGSETEDEGLGPLPAATLVFNDDDDKTENESAILGAATQAMDNRSAVMVDETQLYSSGEEEEEGKWGSGDADLEAATQAIRKGPSPKGKGSPFGKSLKKTGDGKGKTTAGIAKQDIVPDKTQAYELEIDSDEDSKSPRRKGGRKGKSPASSAKKDVTEKTQAYEMEIDSDEDSKSPRRKGGRKGKTPASSAKKDVTEKTQAYEMDIDSDDNSKSGKRKGGRKGKTPAKKTVAEKTQAYEMIVDSDSNSGDAASNEKSKTLALADIETQKIEIVGDDDSDDADDNKKSRKKSATRTKLSTMETQKIDEIELDSDDENKKPRSSKKAKITTMETQKSERRKILTVTWQKSR